MGSLFLDRSLPGVARGRCTTRFFFQIFLQVLRPGLVKGPWTKEEDDIISECMLAGIIKWSEIAVRIPGRIGKQCRERWWVAVLYW